MRVSRISSTLAIEEVGRLLADEDAVALRPDCVSSSEELELAEWLASRSVVRGTNIAKKRKFEFLLWVSGKTDIKSALQWAAPHSPKDMLLVVLSGGKRLIEKLRATNMPPRLRGEAEPLALERISLSRV